MLGVSRSAGRERSGQSQVREGDLGHGQHARGMLRWRRQWLALRQVPSPLHLPVIPGLQGRSCACLPGPDVRQRLVSWITGRRLWRWLNQQLTTPVPYM